MGYKIENTPLAEQDLDGILSYIAENLGNKTAAVSFLDEVDACYINLERMPFMYEQCRDPQLRALGYVEDYEDYYDGPVYTPAGRPVLLTIEDACPEADMVDDDPASIDCGSCRHYHQFPSSLLGGCQNEKLKKKRRGRRSGQSPQNNAAMA